MPLLNENQRRIILEHHWEIGAHSLNHPHLSELNSAESVAEIAQSKAKIESELGIQVLSFAYPFGDYTAQNIAQTKAAGFRYALATDQGVQIFTDPYQIFRVNVFPEDGAVQIWKKSSTWYFDYYRYKKRK
jgi:peptidoglycan/xylan/chitin deacetylase (PgdA/CDA1 family)